MRFEDIPTIADGDALLDQAFARAARTGGAKDGLDAQQSMLDVADHVLSDNLAHVVRSWPDFDGLHPYHRAIADAVVGVDTLRQHLASVDWAAEQVEAIAAEYRPRIRGDIERARRQRKQAFARMADVVEEVDDDLTALEAARAELGQLPGVDPSRPTIVVAGYPNVGKSSFLAAITRASPETATYPFTTTAVQLGHFEHRHVMYQVMDTPGLLDRPAAERNAIEHQAMAALDHLADVVMVIVDPSESCGYPVPRQLALRDELVERFTERDVPVLTVANKSDLEGDLAADYRMSVTEDDGVGAVTDALVEAADHDLELPSRRD